MDITFAARPDRFAPSRRWSRTAAVAVVAAPLLVLGACSGETPGTTATVPVGAGTAPTVTGRSEPTTGTTAAPTPTTLRPKGSITDDVLGHVITPTRVVVNLPWPDNHPVAEEHFELVGVEVKVQAGSRYSASVTPELFTLKTAAPEAVPATNEFKGALGKELGTVKRGQTQTGWLIFKIEKGAATALELRYNRPAYDVKTTGTSIPAKTFSLRLTP